MNIAAFQHFKILILRGDNEQNFVNKKDAKTLDNPMFSAFNNLTSHFNFTSKFPRRKW